MRSDSLHAAGRPATPPVPAPPRRVIRPVSIQHAATVVLPYALTAALVVAIGWPTLILPFWPDSSIFATIGHAIAHGGFPYVDAWDQKPPGIYLIYALAIQGPFGLMHNVRAFDLLWMAATVVAIVEISRRWWSLRAGVIAGLVYGTVYVTASTWWQLGQPDGFINLFLVLALLLHDGARGRRRFLIAAGALLGFAFQLRAISALLIPFFPWQEVFAATRGRFRVWFRHMLWLGVGFAALQAVLALYLAAGGALGEYIAATRFASGYVKIGGPWMPDSGPTLRSFLDAVRFSFTGWAEARLVLMVPAVIGAFYGSFVANDRRIQRLTVFVVLGYVGIALQAKFFWYHYWYLLAFLALLGGWWWDDAYRHVRRVQPRAVALGAMALVAGLLLLSTPDVLDNGYHQWRSYADYYRHPEHRAAFDLLFGGYNDGGGFSYVASRQVSDYLTAHTRPGDSLEIWGYDPLIYLTTGRPNASRFIYALPLMSAWAPKSWQHGFMDEMRKNAPVYFVAQRHEGGPWITGNTIDPADYVDHFPELKQWLDANYHHETDIEDYILYRRNQ
jgi:hypothetical protein